MAQVQVHIRLTRATHQGLCASPLSVDFHLQREPLLRASQVGLLAHWPRGYRFLCTRIRSRIIGEKEKAALINA